VAVEKLERNREFVKAWKVERLGNKELGEKFGLTPGGVKGLKARLRKKDPSLYGKVHLPQRAEEEHKAQREQGGQKLTMVRWRLPEELVKEVRKKAIDQGQSLRIAVEEILKKGMRTS
jgi:hypothetical protein